MEAYTQEQELNQYFMNKRVNLIYPERLSDKMLIDYILQTAKSFETASNEFIYQYYKLDTLTINQQPVVSDDGANTLIEDTFSTTGNKYLITQSETADSRYCYWLLRGMYGINQQVWEQQTRNSIIARNLSLKLIDFILICNQQLNNPLQDMEIDKIKNNKKGLDWFKETRWSILNGQRRFIQCIENYQLAVSYKTKQGKTYGVELINTMPMIHVYNPKGFTQIEKNNFKSAIEMICDVIQILISFFHTTPIDNITYKLYNKIPIAININDIFDFSIMQQVSTHIDNITKVINGQSKLNILQHIYSVTGIIRINNNIQIDEKYLPNLYNYNDELINCQTLYKSYPFMFKPRDLQTHQLVYEQEQEFNIDNYDMEVEDEFYTIIKSEFQQAQIYIKEIDIDELQTDNDNVYQELYEDIKRTGLKSVQLAIEKKLNQSFEQHNPYKEQLKQHVDIQNKMKELNISWVHDYINQREMYDYQKTIQGKEFITFKIFDYNGLIQREQQEPELDKLNEIVEQLKNEIYIDTNTSYTECDHKRVYCKYCYPERLQ